MTALADRLLDPVVDPAAGDAYDAVPRTTPEELDAAVAAARTAFDGWRRSGCSELPHGGFGRSGYGKDLSAYALDHYAEPKHVMIRW